VGRGGGGGGGGGVMWGVGWGGRGGEGSFQVGVMQDFVGCVREVAWCEC